MKHWNVFIHYKPEALENIGKDSFFLLRRTLFFKYKN